MTERISKGLQPVIRLVELSYSNSAIGRTWFQVVSLSSIKQRSRFPRLLLTSPVCPTGCDDIVVFPNKVKSIFLFLSTMKYITQSNSQGWPNNMCVTVMGTTSQYIESSILVVTITDGDQATRCIINPCHAIWLSTWFRRQSWVFYCRGWSNILAAANLNNSFLQVTNYWKIVVRLRFYSLTFEAARILRTTVAWRGFSSELARSSAMNSGDSSSSLS